MKPGHQNHLACNAGIFGGGLGAKGGGWRTLARNRPSRALPTATTESHTKKGMLPDTSALEDRPKWPKWSPGFSALNFPWHSMFAPCNLTDPTPLALHFWWTVLKFWFGFLVPGSTSLFFCEGFTSLHANQGIAFTLLAPWNCGTSASPNPWTINVNHPVQRPETNMQHATICDNDYVLYVHVCTWTWTHHDASKDFPLIQYATILL